MSTEIEALPLEPVTDEEVREVFISYSYVFKYEFGFICNTLAPEDDLRLVD